MLVIRGQCIEGSDAVTPPPCSLQIARCGQELTWLSCRQNKMISKCNLGRALDKVCIPSLRATSRISTLDSRPPVMWQVCRRAWSNIITRLLQWVAPVGLYCILAPIPCNQGRTGSGYLFTEVQQSFFLSSLLGGFTIIIIAGTNHQNILCIPRISSCLEVLLLYVCAWLLERPEVCDPHRTTSRKARDLTLRA